MSPEQQSDNNYEQKIDNSPEETRNQGVPPVAQIPPQGNTLPEKRNKNAVILIVVIAVLVIVAALTAIMIIGGVDNNATKGNDESESAIGDNGGEDDNASEDYAVENQIQRNTQRKDDLNRFLTAVTDYQSNNSGRLPLSVTNGVGTEDVNFVRRYIDLTCEGGASSSSSFSCTEDEFRDPDGNLYQFSIADGVSLNAGEPIPWLPASFEDAIINEKHNIYAVIGVSCGEDAGTVSAGINARQVALLMLLEGGDIACAGNS